MLRVSFNYLLQNKIMAIAGLYFLVSSILKSATSIDICIPCLWQTIFGIHCPACGLTTAFVHLLTLDVKGAFDSNWLIFIIIPIGMYFIIKDFYAFHKRQLL